MFIEAPQIKPELIHKHFHIHFMYLLQFYIDDDKFWDVRLLFCEWNGKF